MCSFYPTMIIYGASGHGKVIAEVLEENWVGDIVFVDDNPMGETFMDYPLYLTADFDFSARQECVVAIGNNRIRKTVAQRLEVEFAVVVHPAANISKRSQLGDGTVAMAGVAVNSGSSVGKHVILNTNSSVDHDCILKDFVHISPNAALAGNVTVGEGTHIGIGACVIQGVKIGKWCTIGAGAVIIRDVPDGVTVVGNPGRIV